MSRPRRCPPEASPAPQCQSLPNARRACGVEQRAERVGRPGPFRSDHLLRPASVVDGVIGLHAGDHADARQNAACPRARCAARARCGIAGRGGCCSLRTRSKMSSCRRMARSPMAWTITCRPARGGAGWSTRYRSSGWLTSSPVSPGRVGEGLRERRRCASPGIHRRRPSGSRWREVVAAAVARHRFAPDAPRWKAARRRGSGCAAGRRRCARAGRPPDRPTCPCGPTLVTPLFRDVLHGRVERAVHHLRGVARGTARSTRLFGVVLEDAGRLTRRRRGRWRRRRRSRCSLRDFRGSQGELNSPGSCGRPGG